LFRCPDDEKEVAEDVKPTILQSNVFNNDGSFFEQFKRMQEAAAQKSKCDFLLFLI